MFIHKLKSYVRMAGLFIIFAIGIVSILATGGGGGSDDGDTPLTGTTISGSATKGPIDGGTANAYAINTDGTKGSLLGTALTETDGSFTIDIGDYVGNVIIEVTGGNYTDEATSTTQTNSLLRTALTNVTGNVTAQVTPLTEMAVKISETLTGIDVSKIDSANALVSNLIGGADILTTLPVNVLSSNASSANLAEQRYGLILACISQMVQDGNAGDISAAITAIANDLADNKMLDDTGNILSTALMNFINSPQDNTSTESSDQLAALISAYMDSTVPDQTFSMDDLVGTWNLVGLDTPSKGGTNSDNYAVDAGFVTLENTGTFTETCLYTSEGACDTPNSGSGFSIDATGFIPALGLDPNEYVYSYMSVGKNFVADLSVDTVDQRQGLSFAVKRATSYSLADLEGSWVSMILRSPVAGGSANDHEFSIENVDLSADGSATATCIANSGGCGSPGTVSGITIDSEGFITVPGTDPGVVEVHALSADKNIIAQISKAPFDQQISIIVRKAKNYSLKELAGTWLRLAFRTPLDADKSSVATGDYGFDVGTLIIKDDGNLSYTCIDTSDSDPCGTVSGMIPGIGVCNITDPLQAGESECGVVSAGKDVIVNMIINRDNEEQELSILLRRSDLGSVGTTYNFADYMPDDSQVGCTSTYVITEGPNVGSTFTTNIVGTETVPYTSGSVTGITIENRDALNNLLDTFITSNDGTTVRFLGYNGYYLAKDCDLSAPSPRWSFSTMYDGMLIDQTEMMHQVNASNTSECISETGNQKLLIKVQDVTIPMTPDPVTYSNAIIMYTLDTKYPFTSLNYSTQAATYGITLPTGFETGDASITDFNVYAASVGEILGGDVSAETGVVNDPYELDSQACP